MLFSFTGLLTRNVKIKKNCVLRVAASHKIPIALHNKGKSEVNNMVGACGITKVEKFTEWVSNTIIVHSPNKMKISLDNRLLCKGIQKPHSLNAR